MVLLGCLAVATMLLAAVGIHGLIATSVTERTREMGIRLALGATRPQALRTLALPGIGLALAGTVIGAAAALPATSLLQHFLWGVKAADPMTFGGVAALIVVVASLASLLPALRVLRVDPSSALRAQ